MFTPTICDDTNVSNALPFSGIDDDMFNLLIYELTHSPINYDPERLATFITL